MTIQDDVRDAKLQCNIKREAEKLLALSSGKIEKNEYLTGEEILPSNEIQIIEQTKFTYPLLAKDLKKQTKKQVDALKSSSFSNKIDELKQIENIIRKNHE